MTLHLGRQYSTRLVSALFVAGFAAVAVWFALSGGGGGDSSGSAGANPAVVVDGDVGVTETDGSVTRLVVPVSVEGDDGVRLSGGATVHALTVMGEGATAAVPGTYTVDWRDGDGDDILESGEHAVMTVELPAGSSVRAGNPTDLQIRPTDSTPLRIEDVLP